MEIQLAGKRVECRVVGLSDFSQSRYQKSDEARIFWTQSLMSMTYALAWKSNSAVYMAADTAITTEGEAVELDLPLSSFGQRHFLGDEGRKKVEERVVKLFLRNNISVAFAGRYDLALYIIRSFYKKVDEGSSPMDALKDAIFLNSPFPRGETVQLAVGYYDSAPEIISFNKAYDLQICGDETLVQMGNPLNFHKKLSAGWIKDAIVNNTLKPDAHLSALLGIFQSYNLFSPQMERGIGGAFCGLYIEKSGGSWQPDILFIERGGNGDKLVSTCFRNDCLIINSPTIGQSRCLLSYLPPQSLNFLRGQTAKASAKGKKLRDAAEFQYLVILEIGKVHVTVIEMDRNRKHDLIWVESIRGSGGRMTGTKLFLFPKLRRLLSRIEPGLVTVGYIPPSVKKIPEDRIIRKEIDNNQPIISVV